MAKTPDNSDISKQQNPPPEQLALFPLTHKEVNGIEMGVLRDGTPYLSQAGLARMCGIHPVHLRNISNKWTTEREKPRGRWLATTLAQQGFNTNVDVLHFDMQSSEGAAIKAYPDAVCMAMLEYYAFEADQADGTEVARKNYRLLARSSFRSFIYTQCGYDPADRVPVEWRNFHERILLNNQLPAGYFSVFREIADLVIHMILSGCPIDDHTVPDISVGKTWSKFWEEQGLDAKRGARKKWDHIFPDWFPQSAANPVSAWVYPVEALGDFRIWVQSTYIPDKFPSYVQRKVAAGAFPTSTATLVIEAVTKPAIDDEE